MKTKGITENLHPFNTHATWRVAKLTATWRVAFISCRKCSKNNITQANIRLCLCFNLDSL